MLNLKKLLTKVVERFANFVVVENKTVQITYASTTNAYYAHSGSVAKSGYTAVGVAGYVTTGTSATMMIYPEMRIYNNELKFQCRNLATSISSTTQNSVIVSILYVKS